MSHRFLDDYYSQFDERISQSYTDNTNARMDAYSTDYEKEENINDQQVTFLSKLLFQPHRLCNTGCKQINGPPLHKLTFF